MTDDVPPLNLESLSDPELLALLDAYPTEAEKRVITRILNARNPVENKPVARKKVVRTEDESVREYRPLTRSAMEERQREIRQEMARNWGGNDGNTYL